MRVNISDLNCTTTAKGSVYNTRTAPSSTKHYTRVVRGGNATTGDKADNHLGYENDNRVISPAVGYKNPLQCPKKDSGCGTDRTDTTPSANSDCRFMRDKNLISSDSDSR